MSITIKARTAGYDNIKAGSATGTERTISGSAPPAFTTYGNTENISVGNDYGAEKHVKAGTTLLAGEKCG